MDLSFLEDVGFTKKEIVVYVKLLEAGPSSAGTLSALSSVSHSKVYSILNRLKKKGLVSETKRGNHRSFESLPPEKLTDYIEDLKASLSKKEAKLNLTLPHLKTLSQNSTGSSHAKVFEGIEGIKALFAEIIRSIPVGSNYYEIIVSDKFSDNENFFYLLRDFHKARSLKKIKAKVLSNDEDIVASKKFNFSTYSPYEFRVLKQDIPSGLIIFENTIITLSLGIVPKAFMIYDESNATQYIRFFKDAWKKAKKSV